MASDGTALEKAAAAVSDGTPVDWDGLESSATDDDERAAIRNLRVLAELSDIPRTPQDVEIRMLQTDASEPPTVEARVPAEPPAGEEHETWGHLELLEKVGEGGFGAVYRARDTMLDCEVALKLLTRQDPAASGGITPENEEEVLREARSLARVRNRNVVNVYGADRREGRVGLWMEFLRGKTLADLMRDQGRFGAGEASRIGVDVCRALAAVHKEGLVHGDVKAQNVMRAEGGRIVLMDFSAVRDLRDEASRKDRKVSGTPLYMAPEIFQGQKASARSDIYGLGVLLFHLVTGTYPVEAKTMSELREAHKRRQAKLLRDEQPDLPGEFIQVVEKALAWDPEERFATVGQMEKALGERPPIPKPVPEPGVKAVPVPVPTPPPPPPPTPWFRAAAAVVLMAGAIGANIFGVPAIPVFVPAPDGAGPVPPPNYFVDATFYKKVGDADVPLLPGDRVKLGDWVGLHLKASRSLHVYVLNEDEAGNCFKLFPIPWSRLRNPLPANQDHFLPGQERTPQGRQFYWELNIAGGREHFLVLASLEPIPELEDSEDFVTPRPDSDQGSGAGEPPRQYASLQPPVKEKLRGFGGVVASPDEVTTNALPQLEARPPGRIYELFHDLTSGRERTTGVWARHIVLENPPER